jgi:two-component system, response regulator, stage 0 sporulation protein F
MIDRVIPPGFGDEGPWLMVTKRVLSVGQCVPDTKSLNGFLHAHFDLEIVPAKTGPEALDLLRKSAYDLVLINRKLDEDYSDGLEIIRAMQAEVQLATVPAMLISNYAEYQQEAVACGARYGFGKDHLGQADIVERLRPYLAG